MNYAMYDVARRVEEQITKTWISGVGTEAKFRDDSEGWYLTLQQSHAKIFLGADRPGFAAGDRVRITVEKVS